MRNVIPHRESNTQRRAVVMFWIEQKGKTPEEKYAVITMK